MNIAQILRLHARHRPTKVAMEYAGRTLSYKELWAAVETAARQLSSAGVTSDDRVGLCMRDHPAHLVYHYAIAAAGAVIVPVDHRWSTTERDVACATFDLKVLVIDKGGETGSAIRTVATTDWPDIDGVDAPPVLPDREHKNLLISLSSGSTGKPKGALVTHRQLYERFIAQWATLGFDATDRFCLVTPMYFGAGRSFGMAFLAVGATVIIAPPPHKGNQLLEALQSSESTATFLVPTVMRRLLADAGDEILFPTLRRLLISGEAFFAEEIDDFKRCLSPNLIGYYASSEGGGISVLQPGDFASHGGSVGQAVFGVEISAVDDTGKEVDDGVPGRLRYRGPGVAVQTLDENGNLNPPDSDGWFYPGDLASIDADGYVSLRGRATDTINRAGVNVYPAEIEAALVSHGSIREAVAMGVADEAHGERIAAFLVTTDGELPDDINTYLKQRLAPYKIPSEFKLLAEMPKANSGKTDKKVLRRLLEAAA